MWWVYGWFKASCTTHQFLYGERLCIKDVFMVTVY